MDLGRLPADFVVDLQTGYPYSLTLVHGDWTPWDTPPSLQWDNGDVWTATTVGAEATISATAEQVARIPRGCYVELTWSGTLQGKGRARYDDYGAPATSGWLTISPDDGPQVLINAGTPGPVGQPGPQGVPGGTDAATAGWIESGTATRVALEGKFRDFTLTPVKRIRGPLVECVIVGSSNATSTTWGPEFCAAWGLTERNYAIAGSAFTSTSGGFQEQLATAAADTAFSNNDVALVVICDASNSIRAANDTGTFPDISTYADSTFAYARANFPNARVVCLPVVWPADPQTQTSGVPGGYQTVWNDALRYQVDQMKTAGRVNGVEVVDQSWTWLTGMTDVMNSDGSVHPNAAGYTIIAQWLSKYLRGEVTRRDAPGAPVVYTGAQKNVNLKALTVYREGWQVRMTGGLETTVAGDPGGFTDVGTIPVGYRPDISREIQGRVNGTATALGVTIYQDGTVRIWSNLTVGSIITIDGYWHVG